LGKERHTKSIYEYDIRSLKTSDKYELTATKNFTYLATKNPKFEEFTKNEMEKSAYNMLPVL